MKTKSFVLAAAAASTLIVGCGKSVDVEGKGMYANANSGVVGIGSFEVVTVPEGGDAARIQYSEDTAWLSPSTKTHAFKINLSGSNSVDKVGGIVSNICQAFIATAPQIAAANNGATNATPILSSWKEPAASGSATSASDTATETTTNAVTEAATADTALAAFTNSLDSAASDSFGTNTTTAAAYSAAGTDASAR